MKISKLSKCQTSEEVYLDDPAEREDFRDSMSDYLEDFRDR